MPGFLSLFDSWGQLAVTGLVLVLAEGVYACFGFGAGLIAVGLLAYVYSGLQDVVVILLLVNLPVELWVVVSSRRFVTWRGVGLVGLGVAAGTPLGAAVLRWGEPTLVLALLGIFLLGAGLAFLLFDRRGRFAMSDWSAPPVGLLSGFLGGLFGTGGPPLIVYFQLAGLEKSIFRGTLMAIFLVLTLVKVPAYAWSGLLTLPRLEASVALMPAVMAGLWLGRTVHIELSETTFRRFVSVLLMVIGAGLLAGL